MCDILSSRAGCAPELAWAQIILGFRPFSSFPHLEHAILIAVVVHEGSQHYKNTDTVLFTVQDRNVFTVRGESGGWFCTVYWEGIVNTENKKCCTNESKQNSDSSKNTKLYFILLMWRNVSFTENTHML